MQKGVKFCIIFGMNYPKPLLQLISALRFLPGVGGRTAERYAFNLLGWDEAQLTELARLITTCKKGLPLCETCGCLSDQEGCLICKDAGRDQTKLCVLSSLKDVYAIEQTGQFQGVYHVLKGLLSPLAGRTLQDVGVDLLIKRVEENGIKEIIIALDSTVEGDVTSLHIKRELAGKDVTISRLAFGLPMGSSLEYVDGGTLALALSGRRSF